MSLDVSYGRPPRPSPQLDHFLLGGAPRDLALVDGDTSLTYAELRSAVDARAVELAGPGLLVLPIGTDVASVVSYLAALALHRPVVLVEAGAEAAGRRADIEQQYAVVDDEPPEIHRDLALLLSTSGSTGSPKLVRLSRQNLLANARSIVDYLALRATDRAITSLPLHYCYGLSVLHSHLLAGAAIVLTDASVAEERFFDLAARHRVTGLAGVPYTFDLLAASGFAERDLPSLRYVTQAGGRLDPDRVRTLAELGQARGWDLYVMYGQTEATARIAYLPPSLAQHRPGAVGVAVPGGSLRIHRPDEGGIGELVYSGPNVMMGYAATPADLSRGRDLDELFTGDLARIGPDGLLEIVGRRDRVAKVFGLRLDLDRVEQSLDGLDPAIRLMADGDVLHAFTARPRLAAPVQRLVRRRHGLPAAAVRVHRVAALPRNGVGKVDEAALRAHVRAAAPQYPRATKDGSVSLDSLRDLYAVLLGRPDAGHDDSFVSLGGDSLSYVELSTRLGARLGQLPRDWPSLTVSELAASAGRTRRWSAPVELGVLLRALAILLIVITHTDLVLVPGGAHLLLAVTGYHFARFTLPTQGRRARTRRILGTVAAVAVPSSLWIAGCAVVTGDYRLTTAVYLNGVRSVGDGPRWTLDWQFWFLEAIVWGFVAVALLLAVPAVDRWQRQSPFTMAAGAVVVTSAVRYLSVGVQADGVERYALPSVLFVLALGWAAAEARSSAQRLLVAAAATATIWGFFGDTERELIVIVAVALLLWMRPLLVPAPLAAATRLLAGASLWIYLTHWQVYPRIEAAGHPVLAILASVAVGLLAHEAYRRGQLSLRKGLRRRSRGRSRGRSPRPTPDRAEHPTAPPRRGAWSRSCGRRCGCAS